MATGTAACQQCGFENHTSCRFCIKCGTNLPELVTAMVVDDGSLPDPPASTEVPRDTTQALLQRIIDESGFQATETQGGWRLKVPLADDRGQTVHVLFDGRGPVDKSGEEGDTISFLSVCGRAEERFDRVLLKGNDRMSRCAFAVRKIRGEDYFVVTASQLASTADVNEIRKVIHAVAQRGDQLELKLAGGEDKF